MALIRICGLTAKHVIEALKSVFARQGTPKELFMDNMPFANPELRKFAQEWGFKVMTSSPTYPQSHGQSERAVQTIKQGLRKAAEGGHDNQLMLRSYRNTPLAGLPYSPTQLLICRRLRNQLPWSDRALEPQVPVDVRRLLVQQQQRAKHFYDRGAKELMLLLLGDSIRVQRNKTWEPVVITAKHQTPRSYVITTPEGHVYWRKRKHLRSMDEAPSPDATPPEEFQQEETISLQEFFTTETQQHAPTHCTSPHSRRSSHISKRPERFKDYVMIDD
uniref:Integrase catalytic domain-containing protein n=1 Tax=Eptatretus burgeri TaxID=7764 RepID=A0A8C4R6N9_EPTBU